MFRIDRDAYGDQGFARIPGFASPARCDEMLARITEIVDHDMGASAPVLMDPGDLLLFDSHLMHCSTDNESDGIRAAMVYHDAATGTRELRPGLVNDFVTVR